MKGPARQGDNKGVDSLHDVVTLPATRALSSNLCLSDAFAQHRAWPMARWRCR